MVRTILTDDNAMAHSPSINSARMAPPSSAMKRENGSGSVVRGGLLGHRGVQVAEIPPGTTVSHG
jgi:hypothetical protein